MTTAAQLPPFALDRSPAVVARRFAAQTDRWTRILAHYEAQGCRVLARRARKMLDKALEAEAYHAAAQDADETDAATVHDMRSYEAALFCHAE